MFKLLFSFSWLMLPGLVFGYGIEESIEECSIDVSLPRVVLTGVPFVTKIILPPFLPDNETIPEMVWFAVEGADYKDGNGTKTRDVSGAAHLTIFLNSTTVDYAGYHTLYFNISRVSDMDDEEELICPPIKEELLAIPGILTLIAPIITALLAILLRQVILALVVGIWICASFANEYNPLVGILRTLDQYMVESIADKSHAAIIAFTFFLGGLIGVVQKSGGGIGLARLLYRFTNSRRKATVVCVTLCFLIFFDDYCAVLIPGNSLRSVMSEAGVSKEKFAYILQSVGPALASTVPISSWIGVQVGYVHSAFDNTLCHRTCSANNSRVADDFVLVVQTIPYRFFPLMMMFCVVFVSVLSRDFGPMLTAERNSIKGPSQLAEGGEGGDEEGVAEMQPATKAKDSEGDTYSGPLAPVKGVPYRWFNAAVPFIIAVITTLLGMILGGRQAIIDHPEEGLNMSIVNIFTKADSVAAFIWASCFASVILFIMLRAQKIIKLSEFMEAWIEGIKDIMEPLLILLLAWALGAAIQDTHTNSYIAQLLQKGGVSVAYIPFIVTIIGFVLAFATGSAFGTMGLLFPLVIPTVCQLAPCNPDSALQATASILSSSIFGNAISPIADITILTTVATKCGLGPHIKTSIPYVFLVGFISLLFGTLPVGAGWYPWYAAWIIMPVILSVVFVLFSSSITIPSSRSLCRIICPCLYTIPVRLYKRFKRYYQVAKANCCNRLKRSVHVQNPQQSTSTVKTTTGNPHVSDETTPLLVHQEGRNN